MGAQGKADGRLPRTGDPSYRYQRHRSKSGRPDRAPLTARPIATRWCPQGPRVCRVGKARTRTGGSPELSEAVWRLSASGSTSCWRPSSGGSAEDVVRRAGPPERLVFSATGRSDGTSPWPRATPPACPARGRSMTPPGLQPYFDVSRAVVLRRRYKRRVSPVASRAGVPSSTMSGLSPPNKKARPTYTTKDTSP